MMKPLPSALRRTASFLLGAVFLLGGLFKLADPVGAGLVMEEYLKFFHLGFFLPASLSLAVLFALAEAFTGAALLQGVLARTAAAAAGLLTGFFTILTFWLWVLGASFDCGCFGEVIHMTPFQTFAKNIALCLLCAVAFLPSVRAGSPGARKWTGFGLLLAGVLYVFLSAALDKPKVDYTEFRPGADLFAAQQWELESGADEDDFAMKFISERNGQTGAFPANRLPDSTWTFVRTESVPRSPRPVQEFPVLSFTDADGVYADTLLVTGRHLVLSVYDPGRLGLRRWSSLAALVRRAEEAGFAAELLCAGTADTFREVLVRACVTPEDRALLTERFYRADRRTLMSLNRSNGGATWFSDGNLIRKWSFRFQPDGRDLQRCASALPLDAMARSSARSRMNFHATLLYMAAALIFL